MSARDAGRIFMLVPCFDWSEVRRPFEQRVSLSICKFREANDIALNTIPVRNFGEKVIKIQVRQTDVNERYAKRVFRRIVRVVSYRETFSDGSPMCREQVRVF